MKYLILIVALSVISICKADGNDTIYYYGNMCSIKSNGLSGIHLSDLLDNPKFKLWILKLYEKGYNWTGALIPEASRATFININLIKKDEE